MKCVIYVASRGKITVNDEMLKMYVKANDRVLFSSIIPTICLEVLRKMMGNLTRTTQHTIPNLGPLPAIVFFSSSMEVLILYACLRICYYDFPLHRLLAFPHSTVYLKGKVIPVTGRKGP
jgi:hypothetical protein